MSRPRDRRRRRHASIAIVGWLATAVLATTGAAQPVLLVPEEYPTIQAAIEAAEDGFEIWVSPGVYAEHVDYREKAILVRGVGGPEVTTIRGRGEFRPVVRMAWAAPQVLTGFTITGGLDDFGVSVRPSHRGLVENCIFTGNAAGALAVVDSAAVDVVGCTFVENTTPYSGGAAYVEEAWATFTDCVFRDNTAGRSGAALFTFALVGEPIVMIGCTFEGNTAPMGGAIDSSDELVLSGCRFQGNLAITFGGAVLGGYGTTVSGCWFGENAAGEDGGAIYNLGAILLGDSTFCGNDPDHVAREWTDGGGNAFHANCACAADLDENDAVDVDDLLALLAAWDEKGAPEDLDGNGIVGFGDLLLLLAAWGPCP